MARLANSLQFIRELRTALTVEEIGQAYVAAVREVIFARGRGLYRLDAPSQTLIGQIADVPEPLLELYATVGREDDPVLEAALAGHRPVASSERTVLSTWSGSRAHQVLLNFGYGHSLKAPLVVGDQLWGSVHFTRFETDPPFDTRDRLAAAFVVDELGAALGRAVRHEQTVQRALVLEAALDCVAQPVIVTDRAGRVLHRNRAADSPVATGSRPVGDVVAPTVTHATELLEAENRRVVTSRVGDGDEPMTIRSVAVPCQRVAVSIVYATGAGHASALPAPGLLTPREQEIATLVSQGLSTSAIAARAFISENTVKQHLKRVFAKLNVRNRAELVQRIWAAGTDAPASRSPVG